jgi:hypothetical protein
MHIPKTTISYYGTTIIMHPSGGVIGISEAVAAAGTHGPVLTFEEVTVIVDEEQADVFFGGG